MPKWLRTENRPRRKLTPDDPIPPAVRYGKTPNTPEEDEDLGHPYLRTMQPTPLHRALAWWRVRSPAMQGLIVAVSAAVIVGILLALGSAGAFHSSTSAAGSISACDGQVRSTILAEGDVLKRIGTSTNTLRLDIANPVAVSDAQRAAVDLANDDARVQATSCGADAQAYLGHLKTASSSWAQAASLFASGARTQSVALISQANTLITIGTDQLTQATALRGH